MSESEETELKRDRVKEQRKRDNVKLADKSREGEGKKERQGGGNSGRERGVYFESCMGRAAWMASLGPHHHHINSANQTGVGTL